MTLYELVAVFYAHPISLPTHADLDIDECANGTDNCQHACFNTDGSFLCTCFGGYTLADNRANCTGKTTLKMNDIVQ